MWLQPGSWLSGPWWLVAAMRPTLSLWWWFAHGWNINRRTYEPRTRERSRLQWLCLVCGGGCGGTLLGCRSTSPTPCGCWLLVTSWNTTEAFGWGGVGGLLFVNYIVDASIFERRALMIGAHPLGWVLVVGVWCVFLMIICVVWRISCYGHTVDALASGADEGRGNLR